MPLRQTKSSRATIELITMRYKDATASGRVSKSIGGETITFSQKDFSDAIETTLSNYRKVILLYRWYLVGDREAVARFTTFGPELQAQLVKRVSRLVALLCRSRLQETKLSDRVLHVRTRQVAPFDQFPSRSKMAPASAIRRHKRCLWEASRGWDFPERKTSRRTLA